MRKRSGAALAAVAFSAVMPGACSAQRAPEKRDAGADGIAVRLDAEARETSYSIVSGDCRITWVVYQNEANRGVIRHRANCGLALGEQAPLIGKLLAKVMGEDKAAADFRTLSWGRLYPDGARDATMAARLALAAAQSKEWDARKGGTRGVDINGWVRRLANEASIYRELEEVFRQHGMEIGLSSVEKVLVLEAGRLQFFERLRAEGVAAGDKVPFDCQTWFSVRRAAAAEGGAKGAGR